MEKHKQNGIDNVPEVASRTPNLEMNGGNWVFPGHYYLYPGNAMLGFQNLHY